MKTSIRHRRGFTLIEVMVAMFVASVMFAIGYGALRQALQNRDHVAAKQARLVALQTAVRVLTQDFSQIEPRPVRDPLGSGMAAALSADPRIQMLVSFTRSGWANPAGAQRSTLQRVAYQLEQHKLVRLHWPVLDSTAGALPVRRELLEGVTAVKFRWLESPGQWHDEWPPTAARAPPGSSLTQLLRMRPIAVELSLETADFGTITRLIEVH